MKKRIAAFFLIIFLCFTVSAAAYAQEESNIDSGNGLRLADMADLLQESEEKALLALLDEMSERQQLDIVVVTANTLNGKTPMEYADDFYDYNDYGFGAQKMVCFCWSAWRTEIGGSPLPDMGLQRLRTRELHILENNFCQLWAMVIMQMHLQRLRSFAISLLHRQKQESHTIKAVFPKNLFHSEQMCVLRWLLGAFLQSLRQLQ